MGEQIIYDGQIDKFWQAVGDVSVVAFDLGGVLISGGSTCSSTEAACWQQVAQHLGVSTETADLARQILWEGWMSEDGPEIGGGSEWALWDRAGEAIGRPGVLLEDCVLSTVRACPAGVQLLCSARERGCKIALASNHAPQAVARWRERFGFLRHVDYWGISFVLGCRKLQPEFYARLIDMCKVGPHEIAFLDDREDNVQAAAEAGIVAVHAPHIGAIY